MASPGSDLAKANELVGSALRASQRGDLAGAKTFYDQFRKSWLDIEGGVKSQSKTAYKDIEAAMGDVQFALLQNPVDTSKVLDALKALNSVDQKFINGGFPADAARASGGSGNLAQVLTLLDQAKAQAQAGDAAGAAATIKQFRQSWLEVEGAVLSQSSQTYAEAEKDMVDAYALLAGSQPDTAKAIAVIDRMQAYLTPIASKTSYSVFDAATILLREGLEALLVMVALLAFLKKSGHGNKTGWIWGGVGAGLAVSAVLAVLVKLLFGTGAFGNNNFLIAGWTGLFSSIMLVWVSYWLHSKSHISEWNRYIKEQSTAALATGSLMSLGTLSFLAVFREGTETVLFFVGMASSISVRDLLVGLLIGFAILAVLAFVILKLGARIPMRPFFLVSSLLVFYLGFKFLGTGVHGLQLAGLLPATVATYLPSVDALALYPNWQSTAPQLLLLLLAVGSWVRGTLKDRAAREAAVSEQQPVVQHS